MIKSLPQGALISIKVVGQKANILCQQSVFELSVLNADDFSLLSSDEEMVLVELARSDLLSLLQKTRFCMAVSDARHYLIGTVFDIQDNRLVCATTDGHRLAVNACALEASAGVRAPIVAKKQLKRLFVCMKYCKSKAMRAMPNFGLAIIICVRTPNLVSLV